MLEPDEIKVAEICFWTKTQFQVLILYNTAQRSVDNYPHSFSSQSGYPVDATSQPYFFRMIDEWGPECAY